MSKILLTGGGTAGHVTPNIALLPSLKASGYDIKYIGSYNGIERSLIANEDISYEAISTGKFRRYFDLKNFSDPLRIIKGYFQAKHIIKQYKPDVLFSKGGFVSVPVVYAAHRYNVPIIIHESDMTPGLANKLCIPYADKVCCNFPETVAYLPKGKAVLSGSPIRKELLQGNRIAGLDFTKLSANKPILLMMGGSIGSVTLNKTLRGILPELLNDFQVIHLCGKNNLDETINLEGYVQYEYISKQLKDLLAAADIIMSRAGANSICEFLTLKKPNILIPLSAQVSRGDQILNANSFKKQGFSYVIPEEELNGENLLDAIHTVYNSRGEYIYNMEKSKQGNGVDIVFDLIEELVNKKETSVDTVTAKS